MSLGFGAALSDEYNYHSKSINFVIGKTSKNQNTEINFKGHAFFDRVKLIEPSELIPKATITSGTTYTTASGNVITSGGGKENHVHIPISPRYTFSGSLTLSQVVNKNFQLALIAEGVAQNGYLNLPFHRVYFQGQDSAKIEHLPDTRYKLPLRVRLNYVLGDKIILRTYYRFYTDSWGITAQKITPILDGLLPNL